ncbi:hypothetical protein [Luteolibacter sp. AS25]|uniref:hypothetical protein n=1 Tax=Luteolibacter sp. AS25 TaxID=3135776 RepID=UPI00398B3D06
MKNRFVFAFAAAATLFMIPPFAGDVSAQTAVVEKDSAESEYPIGKNCIITLDPQDSSVIDLKNDGSVDRGFVAPLTVRGIITRDHGAWLIISEGRYENWVPKSKILMMRIGE